MGDASGDGAWRVRARRRSSLVLAVEGGRRMRGAIFGCYTGGLSFDHYQTCGGDAWVEFSFTTAATWDIGDPRIRGVAWDMQVGRRRLRCVTWRDNCDATDIAVPTDVVPEPITMTLLGTGLLGLGGAGLLRRRRKEDEVGRDSGPVSTTVPAATHPQVPLGQRGPIAGGQGVVLRP